jgi:hypothetical protein
MPKKIVRTTCIKLGCTQESIHKRLCKDHYQQDHPGKTVREFSFRWIVSETFEGRVRATSYKEALELVEKGVIYGERVHPAGMPESVTLVEERAC